MHFALKINTELVIKTKLLVFFESIRYLIRTYKFQLLFYY